VISIARVIMLSTQLTIFSPMTEPTFWQVPASRSISTGKGFSSWVQCLRTVQVTAVPKLASILKLLGIMKLITVR
jgi:hypothetical protein